VYIKVFIKLKPGADDWPTDHQYNAYSVDPAPPAPATTTGRGPAPTPRATGESGGAGRSTGSSTQAAKPAPSAPAAKPAPKPAGPATSSPTASARTTPTPKPAAPPAPAPSAGSTIILGSAEVSTGVAVPQEVLPDSKPELLALLKQRSEDVNTALQQGQLGGVWYPAIGTKDVALALQEKHPEGLTDAQRTQLERAVKLLTVAAWQIDAAGDLGDREKLTELYQQFAAAVADIQGLYGQTR